MDSLSAWSIQYRAQIDDLIQQGQENSLVALSALTSNQSLSINCRSEERCRSDLYDCMGAGKTVLYENLPLSLGTLQHSTPTSKSDGTSNEGTSDVQRVIAFSDGHTIWPSLPLLSTCLIDEFTKRYYQKDYIMEQRENMAGLLARLLTTEF
ncbi:unnamed protein product [Clonostachys rosea]|uniref:Uncharacterized protein n=1 Tax=Bionectria ochroleuca TaxID=29856 RepID=A0ABY6UPM0_BIOOC|nr:unnamed protein product [Clonostachys rosea]